MASKIVKQPENEKQIWVSVYSAAFALQVFGAALNGASLGNSGAEINSMDKRAVSVADLVTKRIVEKLGE